MKLINIGFGNMVSAERLVAVVSPDSAPIKRVIKEAREQGRLIDASYGRSTRAVLIMDSWSCRPCSRRRWRAAPAARPSRNPKRQRRKYNMEGEKYLFVVSGPSGVGKDTVMGYLRQAHPEIEKTVSATTRAPREGEAEGVNYYYRTEEAFKQMIESGDVLEYNYYNGNYYGTLRAEVERRMAAGKVTLLNIDVHGAANIKRLYPGATVVFLLPPTFEVLEQRLRGRGTDSEESVQGRLKIAREELGYAGGFDAWIVNRTVEQAAGELYELIAQRA